ncbi:signal recognition particle subunit srp68, partial [Cladochytrium tenue]
MSLLPPTKPVLETITDARAQHGLRELDYRRYRQYCARKVKRVRAAVGMTQADRRRKFARRSLTAEVAANSRFLEIALFEAERDWSYAMQLKGEVAEEPRRRFHLVKRLRRATEHARLLADVCEQKSVGPRTLLEVQAYSHLMSGYLLLERQSWQEALDSFAASRTIYEKLLVAGTAHQEALCQSFIDAIDPNIRYCAYNLRLNSGGQDVAALLEMRRKADGAGLEQLAAQVDEVLARTRRDRVATGDGATVSWRGKSVPCRNPRFMDALLAAQEAAAAFDKEVETEGPVVVDNRLRQDVADRRIEGYAKVVGAFWDATKIAEADVKEDEVATARVKTSKSAENTSNLRFLHSYVSYLRLSRTLERDAVLVEAAKARLAAPAAADRRPLAARAAEIVRVNDVILRTAGEISELSAVKEDPALGAIAGLRTLVLQARRASDVGQVFIELQQFAEAQAMHERAKEHATEARVNAARLLARLRSSAATTDDARVVEAMEREA